MHVHRLVAAILGLAVLHPLVAQGDASSPHRFGCRILDADGEPVPGEEVGLIFDPMLAFRAVTATTDASGRLDLVVPNGVSVAGEGGLYVVRRIPGPTAKTRLLGAPPVPFGRLRRKVSDLGDLRLAAGRLLCAGRVLDSAGRPIAGARITAENVCGAFDARRSLGRDKYGFCRTVTDAAGGFQLHATDVENSPRRIEVAKDGYFATSVLDAIVVGTLNVAVVMTRTSTIHGRVLGLPDNRPFRGLITVRDKSGDEIERLFALKSPGGRFRIEGCLPGVYTVAFTLGTGGRPFKTVRGVEVRAGKPCRDARLATIDVSRHGRVVRVTVLDPDGKPFSGLCGVIPHVHKLSGGEAGGGRIRTDQRGVQDLVLPTAGADVYINPAGYKIQRFPMLEQDVVVRLERSMRLTLSIKGMPRLPKNLYYAVLVKKLDQRGWRDNWGYRSWGNNGLRLVGGKVVFEYDTPGEYALSLFASTVLPVVRREWRTLRKIRFSIKKKSYAAAGDYVVEIPLDAGHLRVMEMHKRQATELENRAP